jgi:glycosyltransferase involved in cell wall biosynthesis
MSKERPRICVVGSGTAFVSGISYYTYFLSQSLMAHADVSVILMRKLIPRRFYPGRSRVGADIMSMHTSDFASTFDGVDWWGLPSILAARRFLRSQDPDWVIFQWWTGAVLPWYLLLLPEARRCGARIALELHEDQDTGEARVPLVGRLVRRGVQKLVASASTFVVHSEWDRERMTASMRLPLHKVHVVHHGPYTQTATASASAGVTTPNGLRTILFFGTIRPYKGLEFLVQAFEQLPRDGGEQWRLLVVGETWEGWRLPLDLIQESRFRDDIEVINRYVTDEEVPEIFSRANIVALPYLRSSASGPLSLCMSAGLPVVVSDVGGLTEVASRYEGAVMVKPADVDELAVGLTRASALIGHTFEDRQNWSEISLAYSEILGRSQ